MAFIRVLNSFARLFTFEQLVACILSIACLFTALLLAGCSAEHVRGVHILSYSYSNLQTSPLQLRVGYFGICALSSPGSGWICNHNAGLLKKKLDSPDPHDLIGHAHRFRNTINPGLLITVLVLAVAVGLACLAQPGWREETTEKGEIAEVKPIPSTGIIATCAALSLLCLMLQIAAATWQQIAAAGERSATGYAFQGDVSITVGRTAAAFVWLSTGIFFLTSLMGKMLLASLLCVHCLIN